MANASVDKIKALGLRHGEKVVVGLSAALCLLLAGEGVQPRNRSSSPPSRSARPPSRPIPTSRSGRTSTTSSRRLEEARDQEPQLREDRHRAGEEPRWSPPPSKPTQPWARRTSRGGPDPRHARAGPRRPSFTPIPAAAGVAGSSPSTTTTAASWPTRRRPRTTRPRIRARRSVAGAAVRRAHRWRR